nr:uncharacterized protein LOC129058894 isoform X2 [Pongo abelii]
MDLLGGPNLACWGRLRGIRGLQGHGGGTALSRWEIDTVPLGHRCLHSGAAPTGFPPAGPSCQALGLQEWSVILISQMRMPRLADGHAAKRLGPSSGVSEAPPPSPRSSPAGLQTMCSLVQQTREQTRCQICI